MYGIRRGNQVQLQPTPLCFTWKTSCAYGRFQHCVCCCKCCLYNGVRAVPTLHFLLHESSTCLPPASMPLPFLLLVCGPYHFGLSNVPRSACRRNIILWRSVSLDLEVSQTLASSSKCSRTECGSKRKYSPRTVITRWIGGICCRLFAELLIAEERHCYYESVLCLLVTDVIFWLQVARIATDV